MAAITITAEIIALSRSSPGGMITGPPHLGQGLETFFKARFDLHPHDVQTQAKVGVLIRQDGAT